MPHQAVEVEGSSHPCINLIVGHFGFDTNRSSDLSCCLGRSFQRTAFRHVEDDLEFALIVERQHFHFNPTDAHHSHGCQQEANDSAKKGVPPATLSDKWRHEASVHPCKEVFRVLE